MISHAKPQRRKALPRFESDKTSERFVREERRPFFAPLRLCVRNILYAASQMSLIGRLGVLLRSFG